MSQTTDKQIDELRKQLTVHQDALEREQAEINKITRELHTLNKKIKLPSKTAQELSAKMGPMDDAFFNILGNKPEVIREIISTILGVPVIVKNVITQYTIPGFGYRGVRLDAYSQVVKVELEENCYLGEKGANVNVEVQKENKNDDYEYRVFYNGASMVLTNTPRGTEMFKDIARAVVIFISSFDVFKEGEMFYEVHKVTKKSGTPRRSPVAEFYVNTAIVDKSDEHMTRIAKLMELFREPDAYDDKIFPEFSKRKRDLKQTEEGKLELSTEVQMVMDKEREAGKAEGQKNTAGLMGFLASQGRNDDIIRASTDEAFLNQLLNDFSSGILTAN